MNLIFDLDKSVFNIAQFLNVEMLTKDSDSNETDIRQRLLERPLVRKESFQ
jgi:hypothetical protein